MSHAHARCSILLVNTHQHNLNVQACTTNSHNTIQTSVHHVLIATFISTEFERDYCPPRPTNEAVVTTTRLAGTMCNMRHTRIHAVDVVAATMHSQSHVVNFPRLHSIRRCVDTSRNRELGLYPLIEQVLLEVIATYEANAMVPEIFSVHLPFVVLETNQTS